MKKLNKWNVVKRLKDSEVWKTIYKRGHITNPVMSNVVAEIKGERINFFVLIMDIFYM